MYTSIDLAVLARGHQAALLTEAAGRRRALVAAGGRRPTGSRLAALGATLRTRLMALAAAPSRPAPAPCC